MCSAAILKCKCGEWKGARGKKKNRSNRIWILGGLSRSGTSKYHMLSWERYRAQMDWSTGCSYNLLPPLWILGVFNQTIHPRNVSKFVLFDAFPISLWEWSTLSKAIVHAAHMPLAGSYDPRYLSFQTWYLCWLRTILTLQQSHHTPNSLCLFNSSAFRDTDDMMLQNKSKSESWNRLCIINLPSL